MYHIVKYITYNIIFHEIVIHRACKLDIISPPTGETN